MNAIRFLDPYIPYVALAVVIACVILVWLKRREFHE